LGAILESAVRDIVIDSLIVKGFKLFEELKVPKLSRLNLFVGSNNTGKSCLLEEAVRLFATEASPSVIRDLVRVLPCRTCPRVPPLQPQKRRHHQMPERNN
jgi:molybdopterin-guanine dinucleotide biosynthesis protein